MASNLRIGHVGNAITAGTLNSSHANKSGFDEQCILVGSRSKFYWSNTAARSTAFYFNDHNAFAVDFVFWGDALATFDLDTTNLNLRCYVDGDTSVSYGNRYHDTSYQRDDLVGSRNTDLVFEVSGGSSSYTYHRLIIEADSGISIEHRLSYVMPCALFDFGHDPTANFQATQSFIPGLQRHKQKELTLIWRGVSNEKLNTFKSLILKWADMSPIVLYETNDAILQGDTALLCNIIRYDCRSLTSNTNEVRLTVRETV